MILKEINDFTGSEFEQTLRIYSTAFPSVEMKPVDKIVKMLMNDPNYHLYAVVGDSSVIGISLL